MDETVEKLVNRKLLDDARNEEISRIEAEHNSPWNLRSIVGFSMEHLFLRQKTAKEQRESVRDTDNIQMF